MAGIGALGFMGLGKGALTARFFAFACVVWFAILLGLGGLDPVTRVLRPDRSIATHEEALVLLKLAFRQKDERLFCASSPPPAFLQRVARS